MMYFVNIKSKDLWDIFRSVLQSVNKTFFKENKFISSDP